MGILASLKRNTHPTETAHMFTNRTTETTLTALIAAAVLAAFIASLVA